jgi:hypothetical protein
MKEDRRIAAFRCIGILTLVYFSSVPDLLVGLQWARAGSQARCCATAGLDPDAADSSTARQIASYH